MISPEIRIRVDRPINSKLSCLTHFFRVRKYPLHRMEVVLSFGVTAEMVRVAETAIEDHYSSIKSRMGEEVDEIGKVS